MTTQARRDSWLAYYRRNRERINARRRARSQTASGDEHRAAALGYYYEHRSEQNAKRVQRFLADRRRPHGSWSREVAALKASILSPSRPRTSP